MEPPTLLDQREREDAIRLLSRTLDILELTLRRPMGQAPSPSPSSGPQLVERSA